MKSEIPIRKIARLAVITSIIFGLFGATPVFEFGSKDFGHIAIAFLIVFAITMVLWLINTGLLILGRRMLAVEWNWFRFAASIIFSGIIILFLSEFFLPTLLPSFSRMRENPSPRSEFRELPSEQQNQPTALLRPRPRHHILFPFLQILSLNIFIIVLLEMVLLRDKKNKVEIENNLLRVANLQAKHAQLKQQLQPHFLFNSLNVLKTLIRKYPNQAEDYLARLSDLLRFAINSNAQDLITLKQEIELVTNFLEMQKVRFRDAIQFAIEPSAIHMNGCCKVPVYSLQLLVENAIKHNVITTADPLKIKINIDEGENKVTVSNNLQPKTSLDESNGVGLANLSERYKMLGNYEVDVARNDATFSVTIKIICDESSNS